ncbi:MAG: YgiT-type zinc finger protein [Anaerolineaceae bacterium]|nr:YgiT-type zinc finger protein [Anaerolineaceae bacterium]
MITAKDFIPESNLNTPVCTECQAGLMKPKFVTYFTWLGDELVTVHDFPAWVCDICHRCEHDVRDLNQLNLILSPTAGKSVNRRLPHRPHKLPKNPRPSQPE